MQKLSEDFGRWRQGAAMLELVSLYVPVALIALYWAVAVRRPLAVAHAARRRPRR